MAGLHWALIISSQISFFSFLFTADLPDHHTPRTTSCEFPWDQIFFFLFFFPLLQILTLSCKLNFYFQI